AAAFLRAGHDLLSDDLVPVRAAAGGVEALPGYPRMRLWPEEAAHFAGGTDELRRVHPDGEKRWVPVGPGGLGRFRARALPLREASLDETPGPAAPLRPAARVLTA